MSAVRIRISRDELIGDMTPKGTRGNQVIAGQLLFRRLREAGIPVVGTLGLFCVEVGTLTMQSEEGLDGEEFVYIYTGPLMEQKYRREHFTLTHSLRKLIDEENEL